jgi:hypothetical protein
LIGQQISLQQKIIGGLNGGKELIIKNKALTII